MFGDCYHPNGEIYGQENIIPCNSTAVENGENSACCAVGDLCLTNGMCQNPDDNAKQYNWYWRLGCTDSKYADSACPQYCLSTEDDRRKDHMIFSCPASGTASATTHWACSPPGVDRTGIMTDGCNDQSYTFSALAPFAYTTAATDSPSITSSTGSSRSASQASSAASHPTSTTADTTTTSAIATSSPSSSTSTLSTSSSALSSGAKVGLGVGISLGVVLLALVGVIIMLLRRQVKAHWKQGSSGGELLC